MATPKKISQLTAVVTPAAGDTIAVVQGSTTKKMTLTQVGEAIGAGGISWENVTGADTIAAGEGFLVENTGAAFTITIEATIAQGNEYIIHNSSASTGAVDVEPNTSHTIRGPGGSAVGGTDTVLLAAGETLHLIAKDTAILEII